MQNLINLSKIWKAYVLSINVQWSFNSQCFKKELTRHQKLKSLKDIDVQYKCPCQLNKNLLSKLHIHKVISIDTTYSICIRAFQVYFKKSTRFQKRWTHQNCESLQNTRPSVKLSRRACRAYFLCIMLGKNILMGFLFYLKSSNYMYTLGRAMYLSIKCCRQYNCNYSHIVYDMFIILYKSPLYQYSDHFQLQ